MLIQSSLCSKARFAGSDCTICTDICPQHTLVWQNDRWSADRCTSCGLCVANCPQSVFQMDFPSLANPSDREKPLLLACRHNPYAPKEAVRTHCLQQFSPKHYAALSAIYSVVKVYYSQQLCDECQHGWYSPLLVLQLRQYALYELSLQPIAQEIPVQQKTDGIPTNSRRQFFQKLGRDTGEQAGTLAQEALHRLQNPLEDSSPHQEIPPMDLPSLSNALKHYYMQFRQFLQGETEIPLRRISCTACNFCGACVAICPTNALTIVQEEAVAKLIIQPNACNQCGLCKNICMEHGLDWGNKYTIDEFCHESVLAKGMEKTCLECGHTFFAYPEPEQCLCRFCK